MPVSSGDFVSGYRFVRLGEVVVQSEPAPPGARYTGLAVDYDGRRIDEPLFHEWGERKDCGCCVTAGVADDLRNANRFSVKLRQAVNRFAAEFRRQVFRLIPLLVGRRIAEAEVCAQVDCLAAGGQ